MSDSGGNAGHRPDHSPCKVECWDAMKPWRTLPVFAVGLGPAWLRGQLVAALTDAESGKREETAFRLKAQG
eukprot:2298525-Rhodomonas_salina.1